MPKVPPKPPVLVCFDGSLRLADNPALSAAARMNPHVLPVIVTPAPGGQKTAFDAPGRAAAAWLRLSLKSLSKALENFGGPLILRRGDLAEELLTIARKTGARDVFWNNRFEPAAARTQSEAARRLRAEGVAVHAYNAGLLVDPREMLSKSGTPYQVFTAFWNAFQAREDTSHAFPAMPVPEMLDTTHPLGLRGTPLSIDAILPPPDSAQTLAGWRPGEEGALERLREFIENGLSRYEALRDFPALEGTSRLSPHLHFGEIGPRQIWNGICRATALRRGRASHAISAMDGASNRQAYSPVCYLRQIVWREFAHALLHYFPATPLEPLRAAFSQFPWNSMYDSALAAWREGRTGYPIVDAGMRELLATGWMHNRVRMIAASFLVKDLLIPWQEGARYFWDTLVDADLANNTLGWQWVAGCGADAAPYFRIFNPVLQSRKFDANGAYIRRWVPELASLPPKHIHAPWQAPAGMLAGIDYPPPMVDHNQSRQAALAAFAKIRRLSGGGEKSNSSR